MTIIFVAVVVYLMFAIPLVLVIYRYAINKIEDADTRFISTSFILAFFFSCSICIERIVVAPIPTPISIAIYLYEWISLPACIPSSEGCAPPDRASFFILLPFCFQWAAWMLLLAIYQYLCKVSAKLDARQ